MSEQVAHAADHTATDTSVLGGQGFKRGGAQEAHPNPTEGKTGSGHPEQAAPPQPAKPAAAPAAAPPQVAKPAKAGKGQPIVLPFLPDFTWQQWIDTIQAIICLIMVLIGMNDYGKQPLWLVGMGPLILLLVGEDDPKWKLGMEAVCIAGIGGAYAIFNVDAGLLVAAVVGVYNGIDIVVWLLRIVADVLHWVSQKKHGLATLGK